MKSHHRCPKVKELKNDLFFVVVYEIIRFSNQYCRGVRKYSGSNNIYSSLWWWNSATITISQRVPSTLTSPRNRHKTTDLLWALGKPSTRISNFPILRFDPPAQHRCKLWASRTRLPAQSAGSALSRPRFPVHHGPLTSHRKWKVLFL